MPKLLQGDMSTDISELFEEPLSASLIIQNKVFIEMGSDIKC